MSGSVLNTISTIKEELKRVTFCSYYLMKFTIQNTHIYRRIKIYKSKDKYSNQIKMI
jgi:hypothetical protein